VVRACTAAGHDGIREGAPEAEGEEAFFFLFLSRFFCCSSKPFRETNITK